MEWPFGDLPMFGFSQILADPPWTFKLYSQKGDKKSAQAQYACMTLEDIKSLPVSQLAAPDCMLFLWATWPMLPQALDTLAAWGFKYVSGGHWHKVTAAGKQAFGTGYRVRCASEPWLLGVIGNPKNSRSLRNAIVGTVREHSRKPEEVFPWLEAHIPDARRLELFSRQPRAGWTSWGIEAEKFAESAA